MRIDEQEFSEIVNTIERPTAIDELVVEQGYLYIGDEKLERGGDS